ncbi:hypothetical protein DLM86_00290 [Paenibacillus flagellatus]|uniref:HTH arsR-type domain-containing protein n=1 Tax=Paenibacillus flagellatus TaxID=2211139 RepID=A0A2V5L2J7_9BACL|nr:hypothetical protein DLM86_00290 [Paenibacillus flagellatus]
MKPSLLIGKHESITPLFQFFLKCFEVIIFQKKLNCQEEGDIIFSMRQYDEFSVAQAAKVLSDPIRLHILRLLKEGRREFYQSPVCSANAHAICPEDLKLGLGDISSSKLSYHLKELKDAGFIQECREGKRIYYLLQPDRFKSLIDSLRGFC